MVEIMTVRKCGECSRPVVPTEELRKISPNEPFRCKTCFERHCLRNGCREYVYDLGPRDGVTAPKHNRLR